MWFGKWRRVIPCQSPAFKSILIFFCSVSNSRTARRNDKYLASWAEVYRPFKKRKKNKNRKKKPAVNSPITYIKLPATPYNYVQGEGYLSQPATQGNSLMNFLSSVMLSKAPQEQVKSVFAPKIQNFLNRFNVIKKDFKWFKIIYDDL